MNKAIMPTREQYEFLRFKYTYAILHADPATKLVAIHNLMHLMAFYASSDELEEIFAKPLLEKLLQKYSQPLHAFANHNEPIEPLTLNNIFKGQPWTPVPNPECGNS